jgi:hypothetical protein
MTDKTQYNQDGSTSTLTKEEKVRARNKAYREANKDKIKAQKKAYREANKEKEKARSKAYREANKEKEKARSKAYCEANKEQVRAQRKAYREANKEQVRAKEKAYRQARKASSGCSKKQNLTPLDENTDRRREYFRLYNNNRKQKDPAYKFLCNLRSQGIRVVKQLALGKKPTNTYKWIGCSSEELKAHIESLWVEGMTWDNYGRHGWHIDHVRPVSSFSAEEWEQINHYTNLQPLWAEDNLSKSDKYKPKEKPQSLKL